MKEAGARLGVEHVKTARSKHLRSIPRKQDDYSYLELYMLDNERKRLERELPQVGKKGERANNRLEEIKLRMEKLKGKGKFKNTKNGEEAKVTVNETGPKKDWKIVKVDY